MTWRNLTIGESSSNDVRSVPGVTNACYVDGKVSALYFNDDPIYQKELREVVAQEGPPDLVTWGPDYSVRAVIWSNKGLLLFAKSNRSDRARMDGEVLVFSPIPVEALKSSWLIATLPDHMVGTPPEDVVYPFDEDPWGFNK